VTAPNGRPMKNVFQLWNENDGKLPFKVRRWSWHPSTYFLVKEIKDVKLDYFEKTGKLYGKAFGDMYLRSSLRSQNKRLNCDGCYQWKIVTDKSDF